jgi:hypothetical protein
MVDWAETRHAQIIRYREKYRAWHDAKRNVTADDIGVYLARAEEILNGEGPYQDEMRARFTEATEVAGFLAARDAFAHAGYDPHPSWEESDALENENEDTYIEPRAGKAITYAFIDLDGAWHETATMGWWAIETNVQDGYASEFWRFVEGLDPEQRVYVVDCHI